VAYQRKLKPAIYADILPFLMGRGIGNVWTLDSGALNTGSDELELSDGMPKVRCSFNSDGESTDVVLEVDLASSDHSVDAIAFLNHNLFTSGADIEIRYSTTDNYGAASSLSYSNLVGTVTAGTVTNDGDNLLLLNSQSIQKRYYWVRITPTGATFTDDIEIGQICFCRYWIGPHGPDMGGTRPLDFSGVELRATRGGGHNAVVSWMTGSDNDAAPYGQPFRYDQTGNTNEYTRLAGKRRWEHTLSLLDDDDFFTSDLSVGIAETGNISIHELLTIIGGPRHPFIFTPDSTSTTTGDYMWARLVQSSVDPEENSQQILSVDLTIEEEF
jgi:hypothetical protein